MAKPKYNSNHRNVWRRWCDFGAACDISQAAATQPTTRHILAFLGWLQERPGVSGNTAAGYVKLLPTALQQHGNPDHVRTVLSKSVKRAAKALSLRKDVSKPLHRDALPLEALDAIWEDDTLDIAVRAAIVVQFHTGLRGCNVYWTRWARKHRYLPLRWSDITERPQRDGTLGLELRIRRGFKRR